MLNNFTYTLDKIANKVKDKNQKNKTEEFHLVLDNAVSFWCQELGFDYQITHYICQGYKQHIIESLITYLWEESKTPKKQSDIFGVCRNTIIDNPLSQKINSLLSRINPNFRTTSTEFIVLIAFVITAVGFFIYKLNDSPKPTQEINNTFSQTPSQTSDPNSNTIHPQKQLPQTSDPTSNTPSPPKQPYLLVLVVSASNKSLIDSLKTEEKINKENSEKLYQATQYLRQDTEDKLSQKLANLNQYQAKEPSEYDIFLITIELNQADERFKPNVNQLDRYDAFSNLYLANAKIQEISPRLQIEAYGNLDVYSR
ncbi:hypothetical protein [Hydrocoleum sp. CS-953]|uniref:hypothetical protein n=1 Tax=Hydrocoleum sp. CS-953 TaxID=1671698 RepID=UPI00117A08FA|nr:hypothetical protein [Hydrocoleum sp. CS-953]